MKYMVIHDGEFTGIEKVSNNAKGANVFRTFVEARKEAVEWLQMRADTYLDRAGELMSMRIKDLD